MTNHWYVYRDGKTPAGPFSDDQLQQLLRQGMLTPKTQVAKEINGPWVPASGIFPAPTTDIFGDRWHYSQGGKQTGAVSWANLKEMALSGQLSPSDRVWKKGMSKWVSAEKVEGLFVATAARVPPPLRPPFPSGRYSFTKDPATLTIFVKTMLWVSLAVSIISLLSNFAMLNLANSGSITPESADSTDTRQQTIAIFGLLTLIVTGVGFLKWIHRANLNSRGFGAADMKFTPGWSVGFYFIPFLNLVRPFESMKEIWQISKNPADWKNQPGSILVGFWWTLWLVHNISSNVAFQYSMKVKNPNDLATATTMSIISDFVEIPLCLVAVALISAINRRQNALVESSA